MNKYDEIEEVVVEKYNHNHDSLGRFAPSTGGGGAGSAGGLNGKVDAMVAEVSQPFMAAHKIAALADEMQPGDRVKIKHKKRGEMEFECRGHSGAIMDFECTTHTNVLASTQHMRGFLSDSVYNGFVPKFTQGTGTTKKSADYDHIEEVEVEKFNPFHDSRGRFSNKNGFKSYSANPNTRAGAMAIARSAAAGHGNTMNVHSQSYGENIKQNANWLGRGNQGNNRWHGSTTLRSRIEPGAGLSGASSVGAQWQDMNQKQGRTTKPGKQPQQAQQQPKQQPQKPAQQQQQQPKQQSNAYSLDSATQSVTLHGGDKLAIQPRDHSGHSTTSISKVANNHNQEHVVGKDISKTCDIRQVKGNKDPIDKMAELQGWNKAPTVTDNLETFQKAAKQSGTMLIRSVDGNYNTGQSAHDICKKTMTDGNDPLGGNGGKMYGSGMYLVGAQTNNKTGRNLGMQIADSQRHSYAYGNTQMIATVHPNAKIATPTQAKKLQSEYRNLSAADRNRFGDYGTYIASKGYDGARWHDRSDPYITMYNKSAMIFYSGVTN